MTMNLFHLSNKYLKKFQINYELFSTMKKYHAGLILLNIFFFLHSNHAAPQDNWYKSDSWGGVSGAENMIVSDDGLIWIAGNNKIAVHEQNGTLVKEFTQDLANCKDVEIDSQGNVYYADMSISVVRPRCLDNIKKGLLPQRWMGKKIAPLYSWGACDIDYKWQVPGVEYWLKENGYKNKNQYI